MLQGLTFLHWPKSFLCFRLWIPADPCLVQLANMFCQAKRTRQTFTWLLCSCTRQGSIALRENTKTILASAKRSIFFDIFTKMLPILEALNFGRPPLYLVTEDLDTGYTVNIPLYKPISTFVWEDSFLIERNQRTL